MDIDFVIHPVPKQLDEFVARGSVKALVARAPQPRPGTELAR